LINPTPVRVQGAGGAPGGGRPGPAGAIGAALTGGTTNPKKKPGATPLGNLHKPPIENGHCG